MRCVLEKLFKSESIEVKIDAYEGPMDILLNLIAKEEMEITEVPIIKIINQYLALIPEFEKLDLERTTSFLLMASTLLEIKSYILLPEREERSEFEQWEGYDPKEALIEKLVQYKQYKDASLRLRRKEGHYDEVLFKEQEELEHYQELLEVKDIQLDETLLVEAFRRIMLRLNSVDHQRKSFFKKIKRDQFTVEEKIKMIQKQLIASGTLFFEDLFSENKTKEEMVVTFLAMLELLKIRSIVIIQEKAFGPIKIQISH